MRDYDGLPPPLRRWLSEAALPWSPSSCRRIWLRARARGESTEAILSRLDRAQSQALSKDAPGDLTTPNVSQPSQDGRHCTQ
jgi:hypothetical protein